MTDRNGPCVGCAPRIGRLYSDARRVGWLAAIGLWLALQPVVVAGPQHWGFGFGYLVTLEEGAGGSRALSVYEPPLRVKDGAWRLRWRDASGQYQDVLPGCIAVGDFWPQAEGSEQLAALVRNARGELRVRVFDAPDVFSTGAWDVLGETEVVGPYLGGAVAEKVLSASAGDVLGRGGDQLVTLEPFGGAIGFDQIVVYTPPAGAREGRWEAVGKTPAPPGLKPKALAVGDFWGVGRDQVAVLADGFSGPTIVYLEVDAAGDASLTTREIAREIIDGAALPNLFAGADFLKDGFAYVAFGGGEEDPNVAFRVAPRREQRYGTTWIGPDETFAGARLADQALGAGRRIMLGEREAAYGRPVAATAGRVFGYVAAAIREREAAWADYGMKLANDVEIAFVRRAPLYAANGDDGRFGWPASGEEVTYTALLKNNGKTAIEEDRITLRGWVNTAKRNADTLPDAAETANFELVLDEPLAPFDPENPQYFEAPIKVRWPYALEQPAGWGWQRLNVGAVGERWLVLRVEYRDDENVRNDRYETALHASSYHPTLSPKVGVAARIPTVSGDPESMEYAARKLADAVQCLWARSRTSDGGGVMQRVTFSGYRIAEGADEEAAALHESTGLLSKAGDWGNFERFGMRDVDGVLAAVEGDFRWLDGLTAADVYPAATRRIALGDGGVMQMRTRAWAPDVQATGHTLHGVAAADLQQRLVGVRSVERVPWRRMAPQQVDVRVLDRAGQPAAGVGVKLWALADEAARALSSGTTDANGVWNAALGGQREVFAPFNLPLLAEDVLDGAAMAVTIEKGGYRDFHIFGADSVAAHSQRALVRGALTESAGWTWTAPTLYAPGADAPDFNLRLSMRGSQAALQIDAKPHHTYTLYRRWSPTYAVERIATHTVEPPQAQRAGVGRSARRETGEAADTVTYTFTDDLGAVDWYGAGRTRAVYYVTESFEGRESLPSRAVAISAANLRGVADAGDGQLLVTLNAGTADPFAARFRGAQPAAEWLRRERPSYTPLKVAPSRLQPDRYYATLLRTGAADDARQFDVIASDGSGVSGGVSGSVAGLPGSDAAKRELRLPRGLAVITRGDREYVVIADTGNGRIVVWDADARFVAQFAIDGWRPAAVAAHPTRAAGFFVLSRSAGGDSAGGRSEMYELTFDGEAVQPQGRPVIAPVSDSAQELGLAAAVDPVDERVVVALTDASQGRVYEMKSDLVQWQVTATYTTASGSFIGEAALQSPRDAAYTLVEGALALFVIDGGDRVVRLR